MANHDQILIRRLAVKTGGWLSRKSTLVGWSAKEAANEALCRVSLDGSAVDLSTAKDPFEGEKAGDSFFAVFRARFPFSLTIDAGPDADGFRWTFSVKGFEEILRPECFAASFRGVVTEEAPLTASMLEKHLGTIPSTIMHDKVVVDVLGVASLADKDAQGRYVDMQYRLEQSKEVGEAVVSAAIDAALAKLLGVSGAVKTTVTTFHATSAERELAIMQRKAADEELKARTEAAQRAADEKERAKVAADQKAADEDARWKKEQARIADQNKVRRDEEQAEEEHKLKLAEIRKWREALEGPRPEIRMSAQVLGRGKAYGTRDLVPDTSSYGEVAMARPANTLSIGDRVRFELSANFDGWLHVYNYGTSGNVLQLVPSQYSKLSDGRIDAGRTYVADQGGDMISVALRENGPTTPETGNLERFIAIITKKPVNISTASVKELFDRRNSGRGFATRGGFGSVEEVRHAEEPLEVAVASILDLPPEDWLQGTLELEVV